jgi:hypothetical protein
MVFGALLLLSELCVLQSQPDVATSQSRLTPEGVSCTSTLGELH